MIVLGFCQVDAREFLLLRRVHVLPSHAHDFSFAHSGGDSQNHHQIKVGICGGSTGGEQRLALFVCQVPQLRKQIEASLTGTSPTMKNISKPASLALRLPLPPLDVQQTLIAAIGKARADALALRQQAKQLREQAKREIEAALLGCKNFAAKQTQ